MISTQGVEVDPTKVEAMKQLSVPKELSSLQGLLGLTGYYQLFVNDYGKIAQSLTKLIKDNLKSSAEAQQAFDNLREL